MSIGGYTFLDLQEEVLSHQFAPNKYRELVRRWLNQAQRRAVIESEIRTQEASDEISTEAGTLSYQMPSDFAREIDFVETESKRPLTPADLREFDTFPSSTGRPSAYTVIGSQLALYPTPDAVYPLVFRYWKLPQDMVSDTDTPEIPVQYQELLTAFALKKAFQKENDWQEATSWEAQWEKGILKMRGEVQSDVFDGPRQVSGSWEDPHQATGTLQRP